MIVSFNSLGKHGRLANQLFQIASTIGIAKKYKATPSFPQWDYEKYFDTVIPHGEISSNQIKEERFSHYDLALTESCDLHGYFQSHKYFSKGFNFKFKQAFLKEVKDKHTGLFDKQTICIHIRRGDYVGNPNYYQLPVTYYIDTLLNHFEDYREFNILFISDNIEYCKVHFGCLPNTYFANGTDIEDMALGSCCDHFILANSSYSWWTAFIGEKKHSKVIHPGHYFTGELATKCDTVDFWPRQWRRNQKDNYKIPLKDVTFTIPIHYDHSDRKKNASLTLCMLQTAFDTNYIVMEQGWAKFEYMKEWVKYVQFPGSLFHRTKMLNDMAKMADTVIVVNYDCDVIMPPMQIYLAIVALRNGADMIFPYDGRFARMLRHEWFDRIQSSLDIGIVGNTKFKGGEHGHNSVGGCVMFTKKAFIAGGMENEKMISFGPEDCERNDRFKMLGYKVIQIAGPLFHMDHYIGPNSSKGNPHFHANHVELEKIRKMDATELRTYVDTWQWTK